MTPNETRHSLMWESVDYQRIYEGFRLGLVDEEVASLVGRSPSAIASRLRLLYATGMGDDSRSVRKGGFDVFREFIDAESETEWMERARLTHKGRGLPWWDETADALLQTAWEAREPAMPALAEQLEMREDQIAARLIRLGIADATVAVVDRLGCTPGGLVDIRARLARDKTSAMLWTLVISDQKNGVIHTSLHPDEGSARQQLEEWKADDDEELDYRHSCHWAIAPRVVGEGSVRRGQTGKFFAPLRAEDREVWRS
ncbi:hypothetical protein [Sinomonas sp. ASV322]|uniref:hypothetical protein n=1 Tax=Sinomonas sp. ASV322 TaxID=3041920 RepID=UPI0027DBC776|nr:hypothetical protein [Sinomonas sp. ASV322]MDQ4504304.1 hypothetical protein [Sinomonas sp. ASV322]